MKPSRTITIVRNVYDNVECALWAALLSFVIYFVVCIAPNLPESARRAQNLRALQIAAENGSYCEKWGMKRQTHEHTLCTMDLQELRNRIEQDLAERGSVL